MTLVQKALSIGKLMPQLIYQLILVGVMVTTVFFIGDVAKKLQKNFVNLVSTVILTT